jgi:uncharacterized protein YrrD
MTMDTNIQFQKNATVVAASGQQVGSLNRVVVDPNTKVLTDIVVRTGVLFNQEERVVPIELVDETTADLIVLHEDAGDLSTFPPFEERRLIDPEGDIERPQSSGNEVPQIYGYPGGVFVAPTSGEKFNTMIEQNIPSGTVALKEGAVVITAEGKHVGKVERVLAEAPADRATHLLISTGMFIKETKLVPINWVQTIYESEVHLRVKKDSVEELANTPVAG